MRTSLFVFLTLYVLTAFTFPAHAVGVDTAPGVESLPFSIHGKQVMDMTANGLQVTTTAVLASSCQGVTVATMAQEITTDTPPLKTGRILSCQAATQTWQLSSGSGAGAGIEGGYSCSTTYGVCKCFGVADCTSIAIAKCPAPYQTFGMQTTETVPAGGMDSGTSGWKQGPTSSFYLCVQ